MGGINVRKLYPSSSKGETLTLKTEAETSITRSVVISTPKYTHLKSSLMQATLQLRLPTVTQAIDHNLEHQLAVCILGFTSHLKRLDSLAQTLETMCD
jgi:hypothetical protein